MKKLILVVGILTQSYFGISQELKVVNHHKIPGRSSYSITSFENVNDKLYGLFFGYNQHDPSTNLSNPYWIVEFDKDTLNYKNRIKIKNIPKRPLHPGTKQHWENLNPGKTYNEKELGKLSKSNMYIRGLTFDGRYFWIADPTREKLHKISKSSGEYLGSIPAPSMPNAFCNYSCIEYHNGYFWVVVENKFDEDYIPILYKLSRSGKIIKSYNLEIIEEFNGDEFYLKVDGMSITKNGDIWFNLGERDMFCKFSIKTEKITEQIYVNHEDQIKFKHGWCHGLGIINGEFYISEKPRGYNQYKKGNNGDYDEIFKLTKE